MSTKKGTAGLTTAVLLLLASTQIAATDCNGTAPGVPDAQRQQDAGRDTAIVDTAIVDVHGDARTEPMDASDTAIADARSDTPTELMDATRDASDTATAADTFRADAGRDAAAPDGSFWIPSALGCLPAEQKVELDAHALGHVLVIAEDYGSARIIGTEGAIEISQDGLVVATPAPGSVIGVSTGEFLTSSSRPGLLRSGLGRRVLSADGLRDLEYERFWPAFAGANSVDFVDDATWVARFGGRVRYRWHNSEQEFSDPACDANHVGIMAPGNDFGQFTRQTYVVLQCRTNTRIWALREGAPPTLFQQLEDGGYGAEALPYFPSRVGMGSNVQSGLLFYRGGRGVQPVTWDPARALFTTNRDSSIQNPGAMDGAVTSSSWDARLRFAGTWVGVMENGQILAFTRQGSLGQWSRVEPSRTEPWTRCSIMQIQRQRESDGRTEYGTSVLLERFDATGARTTQVEHTLDPLARYGVFTPSARSAQAVGERCLALSSASVAWISLGGVDARFYAPISPNGNVAEFSRTYRIPHLGVIVADEELLTTTNPNPIRHVLDAQLQHAVVAPVDCEPVAGSDTYQFCADRILGPEGVQLLPSSARVVAGSDQYMILCMNDQCWTSDPRHPERTIGQRVNMTAAEQTSLVLNGDVLHSVHGYRRCRLDSQ